MLGVNHSLALFRERKEGGGGEGVGTAVFQRWRVWGAGRE